MDVNKVADQVQQHATEAEGKAREMANKAQQAAERAREKGREIANKAADAGRRAKGVARDAGAAADLYVHEYTYTTMLMVAVVAGTIGYMLGRRS
jgi:ElaB/YqjD/DUF883 family membrane-anchored ribosome-binding protein